MNDDKRLLKKLSCALSHYHYDLIADHATKSGIPITRIVGCLVDHAIENDMPFEYDMTLPNNDDSHLYSDEGGRLLEFLRDKPKGIGLDVLMAVRHDLNIRKEALLSVLSDCLQHKLIEAIKPIGGFFKYPEGYFYYRITKEKGHGTKRKNKNRANEYDQYLKLKKKYESEA